MPINIDHSTNTLTCTGEDSKINIIADASTVNGQSILCFNNEINSGQKIAGESLEIDSLVLTRITGPFQLGELMTYDGITLRLTGLSDPVHQLDAANKRYVDAAVSGGAAPFFNAASLQASTGTTAGVDLHFNLHDPTSNTDTDVNAGTIPTSSGGGGGNTINSAYLQAFNTGTTSGVDLLLNMYDPNYGNYSMNAGNVQAPYINSAYVTPATGTVAGSDLHFNLFDPSANSNSDLYAGTIPSGGGSSSGDAPTVFTFTSNNTTSQHEVLNLNIPYFGVSIYSLSLLVTNPNDPSDYAYLGDGVMSVWCDNSGIVTLGVNASMGFGAVHEMTFPLAFNGFIDNSANLSFVPPNSTALIDVALNGQNFTFTNPFPGNLRVYFTCNVATTYNITITCSKIV